MAAAFTTAIEAWDKRWATAEGRADWLDPEPEIITLLPELKARGARTVLDLGCGVGRHALFLAEHGLAVEAIDGSAAGLAVVRETAQARSTSLGVRQGTADALPFDFCSFDFVLSWNVIHHGTLGDVGRRLAEIWRVLKPKALFQGTMLPTRNINYGRGRIVAPDTFVVDRAEDRAHPHFYCDAATLVALYAGFELPSLKQQLQRKPGSWHWHIIAERRPQQTRNVTIFATHLGHMLRHIMGRTLERFSIGLLHPPIPFVGLACITPTPTRPHRGGGSTLSGPPPGWGRVWEGVSTAMQCGRKPL